MKPSLPSLCGSFCTLIPESLHLLVNSQIQAWLLMEFCRIEMKDRKHLEMLVDEKGVEDL